MSTQEGFDSDERVYVDPHLDTTDLVASHTLDPEDLPSIEETVIPPIEHRDDSERVQSHFPANPTVSEVPSTSRSKLIKFGLPLAGLGLVGGVYLGLKGGEERIPAVEATPEPVATAPIELEISQTIDPNAIPLNENGEYDIQAWEPDFIIPESNSEAEMVQDMFANLDSGVDNKDNFSFLYYTVDSDLAPNLMEHMNNVERAIRELRSKGEVAFYETTVNSASLAGKQQGISSFEVSLTIETSQFTETITALIGVKEQKVEIYAQGAQELAYITLPRIVSYEVTG